ncbi:MAG: hypothetical protein J6331_09450 [Lentisphaeria bacterium]|nr:hypothetical protein [Lentisphaeria bacterium]
MKGFLKSFLNFFSGAEGTAFQYGYLTGAAVSILILILIFLLVLLFRARKKCQGVLLSAAGGSLYISASAIADLVKSAEKDFQELQILKTVLTEKKEFHTLELRVNFPPEEGTKPLPVIAEALREKIFLKLKDTFGIESVKEINIEVIRGKRN